MASDEPIERKIRADYARGAELFDGRAMGLVLSWLDAARKRAEEAERALAAVCEEAQTEAAEAGFQAMLAVTKRADAAERDAAYLRATVTEERAAREAAEKRAEEAERERDAEREVSSAIQGAASHWKATADAAEKRIGELEAALGPVAEEVALILRHHIAPAEEQDEQMMHPLRGSVSEGILDRMKENLTRARRALTPTTGGE